MYAGVVVVGGDVDIIIGTEFALLFPGSCCEPLTSFAVCDAASCTNNAVAY